MTKQELVQKLLTLAAIGDYVVVSVSTRYSKQSNGEGEVRDYIEVCFDDGLDRHRCVLFGQQEDGKWSADDVSWDVPETYKDFDFTDDMEMHMIPEWLEKAAMFLQY